MDSKHGINPACFFCHLNFDSDTTVNVFNLRQLFRYLKIKLNLDQNSVLLCSQCNTLGLQLYQQILQLEVTRIKINYSLEQLVTKIRRDSGGDDDVLQKLVKEKGISKLRNVKHPQVKLKRLPQVRLVISEPENSRITTLSPPLSPAPPSPVLTEPEQTIVKLEVNNRPVKRSITTLTPKPKSRRLSTSSKTCQFCLHIFPFSQTCYHHQVKNHPDKLLFDAKLDTITDSQFLQICKDVLARHIIIQSPLTNVPNRYGCQYCQNLYGEMKYLKHHTIKSHLPSIIEKVEKLQKTVSQYEPNEHDNDKEVTCQYCTTHLTNQIELQNHKNSSCESLNEEVALTFVNLVTPVAPPIKTHQDISDNSKSKSATQNKKEIPESRHKKIIQSNLQNLPEAQAAVSENEDAIMPPISPPPSPASPSPLSPQPRQTSVKMEVDDDHSPIKLDSNQKNNNESKPIRLAKACKFCSKGFQNSHKRDYHEVLIHPEKILSEGKLDNTPNSLFLKICNDLLSRNKRVTIPNLKTPTYHRCIHCRYSFVTMASLKRHTTQSHFPITVVKLRQLQQTVSQNTTSNDTSSNLACLYCTSVFTNENDLINHKEILCEVLESIPDELQNTESTSLKIKPDPESNGSKSGKLQDCKFCPKILTSCRSRDYHEAITHPDQLLLEGKLESILDSQYLKICQDMLARQKVTNLRQPNTSNLKPYGCLYCENRYTEKRFLMSHTIETHRPNALEKVRDLQQIFSQNSTPDNNLLCWYCNSTFKNGNKLVNHKVTSCQVLGKPAIVQISESDEVPENGQSSISSNLKIKMSKKTKLPLASKLPTKCSFCPEFFSKAQLSYYHEATHHPDKLLLDGKLNETSDSQFLEICQDVLTRYSTNHNLLKQYGCLYCPKAFIYLRYVQSHTIKYHLSNSIEKVRQMQKLICDKQNSEFSLRCRYCDTIFTSESDLKSHKETSCETLGKIVVLKAVNVGTLPGQRKPCKFCSKTFNDAKAVLIHSTNIHCVRYLIEAKFESVSDEQFEICCQDLFTFFLPKKGEKDKRVTCRYCEKLCPDVQHYKSHLVDKHKNYLLEKLKELQKEPPKTKICIDERGIKVCKRVCPHCGKWYIGKRLGAHIKYMCKERKDKVFFKVCKCFKRFYSLDDFSKHCCPGNKNKKIPAKRIQCEKCGAHFRLHYFKQYHLKMCGKPRGKGRGQRNIKATKNKI